MNKGDSGNRMIIITRLLQNKKKKIRLNDSIVLKEYFYKRKQRICKLAPMILIKVIAKYYATGTQVIFQEFIEKSSCSEILSQCNLTLHKSDQDLCDENTCKRLWFTFSYYLNSNTGFWYEIDEANVDYRKYHIT